MWMLLRAVLAVVVVALGGVYVRRSREDVEQQMLTRAWRRYTGGW